MIGRGRRSPSSSTRVTCCGRGLGVGTRGFRFERVQSTALAPRSSTRSTRSTTSGSSSREQYEVDTQSAHLLHLRLRASGACSMSPAGCSDSPMSPSRTPRCGTPTSPRMTSTAARDAAAPVVGRIYLDLHPREGAKARRPVRSRPVGRGAPAARRRSRPQLPARPPEHGIQVVTPSTSSATLVHHVPAGHVGVDQVLRRGDRAGTVEAPSQMLEEAWTPRSCRPGRPARRRRCGDTGEPSRRCAAPTTSGRATPPARRCSTPRWLTPSTSSAPAISPPEP